MGNFSLNVEKTNYEITALNYNNIIRYEIYKAGLKQFVIEPTLIYDNPKNILWRLTEENKSRQVDYSTIAKLGAAIEAYNNLVSC